MIVKNSNRALELIVIGNQQLSEAFGKNSHMIPIINCIKIKKKDVVNMDYVGKKSLEFSKKDIQDILKKVEKQAKKKKRVGKE